MKDWLWQPIFNDMIDLLSIRKLQNYPIPLEFLYKTVVTGSSSISVEVKEIDRENKTFKSSRLVSLGDDFINTNKWQLSYFDPKYGSNDREIWNS